MLIKKGYYIILMIVLGSLLSCTRIDDLVDRDVSIETQGTNGVHSIISNQSDLVEGDNESLSDLNTGDKSEDDSVKIKEEGSRIIPNDTYSESREEDAADIVVYDDFERYELGITPEGWEFTSGTWKVIDDEGNKVLSLETGGGSGVYALIGPELEDCAIKLKMKIIGGSDWGFGPVMRYQSLSKKYEFEMWHSRDFIVLWVWDGGYTQFGQVGTKPFGKNIWRNVECIIQDDTFACEVEGVGEVSGIDKKYKKGRVGLNGSGKVYFDDFKVTKI